MLRRYAPLLIVIAVLLVALVSITWAADAPAPAAQPKKDAPEVERSRSLFTIIDSGGPIGYFILFLNVIVIALAIEHFMTIRRAVVMPPDVLADIEDSFEKQEYDKAIVACEERPTMFTNIVAAGLARINLGHRQMDEAMSIAAEEGQAGLQHKIGYLALIANLGPMLGLMGTTVSMILAFGQIAQAAAPKPSEVADSIQLALVTTFEGLATAVLAQSLFHFFKNKVQSIMIEVLAVSSELMARFRPVE